MSFEEVPVSFYTGQPNISIPFFSKSIAKDLDVDISLSYNTQGVRVFNRSSWTGNGWSLNAGGVISRTVRGLPDESPFNSKKGVFYLDDFWNYANLSSIDKQQFNWNAAGTSTDKYDTDVDLYQFNFLNYTGRFVIVKENNALVAKQIGKNYKFKIELYHDSNYQISSIVLTDPKGYKYTFDVIEVSTVSPFTGVVQQGNGVGSISSSGAADDYTYRSSWHLSSISTSNSENLVVFNYSDDYESYIASKNRINNDIVSNVQEMTQNSYNQSIMKPESVVTTNNMSVQSKKISNIVFRDSIKVLFKSTTSNPETQGKALNKIEIYDINDQLNKQFSFLYEYSNRFWLVGIDEISSTGSILPYEFEYYQKDNLPLVDDAHPYDDWGYFSGIASPSNCETNSFDENQINTGLLSRIEYPTGGVKEFTFENNSFSFISDQVITSNDYQKNPKNIVYGGENFNLSYNHYKDFGNLPKLIGTIDIPFEQDICIYSNLNSGSEYGQMSIELSNGLNGSGHVPVGTSYTISNAPPGTYNLYLRFYNQSIPSENFTISGSAYINYATIKDNPEHEILGGGARIKSIAFKEDKNTTEYKRKISYDYKINQEDLPVGTMNPSENFSSGVVDSFNDWFRKEYSYTETKYLFSDVEFSSFSFLPRSVTYSVTEEGVNADLTQGSYVGYRQVEVIEEGNGHTIYNYTSPYDYFSSETSFMLPYGSPKQNLNYKRGLLLKTQIYNNDGLILKEVNNLDASGQPNYTFQEDFLFKRINAYKNTGGDNQFFDTYSGCINDIPNNIPSCGQFNCLDSNSLSCNPNAIILLTNDFNSGWAKLKGSTTKDYFYDDLGNMSVVKYKESYLYNDSNYQIKEKKVHYNESGQNIDLITKYYYPVGEIPLGYVDPQNMRDKLNNINKVNEVLVSESYKNNLLVSKVESKYEEFAFDQVLPSKTQVQKGEASSTNQLEDRIEYHKYDDYGNPLEVSKADGTHIVYIWGYGQTQPIAKIENAIYEGVQSYVLGLQLLSDADIDHCTKSICTEQQLREALNNLRVNLPNSLVSTYTYDSLIGVTSMTDSKGKTIYYEYDEFNRLEYIKDEDGNILNKNQYNYTTQN